MMVRIKFFASLRETLGVEEESLEVPLNVVTIADLRRYLMSRGDTWSESLALNRSVKVALNHAMVDGNEVLIPEAEVAFFPPVTGG